MCKAQEKLESKFWCSKLLEQLFKGEEPNMEAVKQNYQPFKIEDEEFNRLIVVIKKCLMPLKDSFKMSLVKLA